MQIIAVLLQELGVGVVERQPVAASLQLGHVVVAFPVFVARRAVRVETVVVRTLELFPLAVNCVGKKKQTKKLESKHIVICVHIITRTRV